MAFKDELETKIKNVFSTKFTTRTGTAIPSDTSVTLGNDSVEVDATVLYADLTASTNLVDTKAAWFAAQVYKAYLLACVQIIKSEGGEVTAFDGDRVMGVFMGDLKNNRAIKAALKINGIVRNTINPAITAQYGAGTYTVTQVVGIDTSKLFVAKTGIRGANDLVWVGRAANHAAKMCSINEFPTWISKAVYDGITGEAKYSNGVDMWQARSWTQMNKITIYGSTYQWNL